MTKQTIKLDEKDRKIINLLHENQDICQEEIAKKINLSQPSVAMRIKKLKEKGVLDQIIGFNLISWSNPWYCNTRTSSNNKILY